MKEQLSRKVHIVGLGVNMGLALLDYRGMSAPNDGLQTLEVFIEENQEGIGPLGDSKLFRKFEVGPCIAAEHCLEAPYACLRAKPIVDHELDEARNVGGSRPSGS